PVAVVNPRRVRWFARSTGQEAKTDAHDALVLAQFGCLTRPTPQPAPTPSLGQLRALVRRREQLVAVRATERQRARQWQRDDAAIYQGCLQLIATLTATIAALDTRIAALVATDATLGHRLR